MSDNLFTSLMVLMAVVFIALLVFFVGPFAGRMASESKAEQAVTNAGYTQVHLLHRHVWFMEFRGCSDKDDAQFVFSAVNPIGNPVTVKVCEGWPWKGATIRN